jgi:hypothetical protein
MKTARIANNGGLWILVDDLENPEESNALPITEDEIEPIRDACESFLEELSQSNMKQFYEDIDNPPEANEALKDLLKNIKRKK